MMRGKSGRAAGLAVFCAAAVLLGGCHRQPQAVASASINVYYQQSTLSQEALLEAMRGAQGSCAIASVNEDGTPNIANFVPGVADESHIAFAWEDNQTKRNLERTGHAMLSYFIYRPEEQEKARRNTGARLRLTLETDLAVRERLLRENPQLPQDTTFLKIEEIVALG